MVDDVVRSVGFLALGTRMKRIGERLQADTQAIIDAAAVPIQASQFPFLAALDRLGPLTIGELAQAIGITQPGVTRAVVQLASAGLVETRTADDDQRRRIVSLSSKGQQLVASAKRDLWPRIAGAVADLCGDLDGPLLEQLSTIEEALDERPLHSRLRRKEPAT